MKFSADYIGSYLTSRKTRSLSEQEGEDFMTISSNNNKMPTLPDQHKHAFHGGERAILYGIAEDFLSTFGVDGKACILRTICEIHSKKTMDHLGFLGEVAKLFFTYVLNINYSLFNFFSFNFLNRSSVIITLLVRVLLFQ